VRAFDAGDKDITVRARYFLVDKEGRAQSVKRTFSEKYLKTTGYKSRSTWLIKYDARDDAGNHAEQVVFALVFDDVRKPRFVYTKFSQVEAATQGYVLPAVKAIDNIDDSALVTKRIRYTIEAIPAKENSQESPNKALPTKPFTLRKNAALAAAKWAIDTDVTGKYLIKFYTKDNAGIYGKNSKSNTVSQVEEVQVVDTTAPTLHVHGTSPMKTECSFKTFTDWGAHAYDSLDTARLGRKLRIRSHSNVNLAKNGKYRVNYNTADAAGNKAKTATRKVIVYDSKKPNIRLVGAGMVTLKAGLTYTDAGVQVYDNCPEFDGSNGKFQHFTKKALKTTFAWSEPLKTNVPGSYTITWTTCERRRGGLCSKTSRNVVVEDRGTPDITLQGKGVEYYEASRDLVYTDKGAKCHDGVEGDISHAVEVSGEVVNMKKPKCYSLRYDCQDNRGNQAEPVFRKVCVRDTTCPKITIAGPAKAYVEAGFFYQDAGATATDTLDGDISSKIETDGNTVDAKMAFLNFRSCNDIKNQYSGAKSGDYMITLWNAKSAKVERVTIWCDMYNHIPQTYHLVNQQNDVKTFNFDRYSRNTGSCPYGSTPMSLKLTGKALYRFTRKFGKQFYLGRSGSKYSTDQYVCRFTAGKKAFLKHSTKKMTRKAEVGKYTIQFYVADKAGNDQCHKTTREIIVKDTLPPVISLKYKTNQFHKSYPKQRGVNGETNPAIAYQDKLFMAESASVNGWAIAALASAITGVALLAVSAKQTTTTVPV
jgi:hypothetical protein